MTGLAKVAIVVGYIERSLEVVDLRLSHFTLLAVLYSPLRPMRSRLPLRKPIACARLDASAKERVSTRTLLT